MNSKPIFTVTNHHIPGCGTPHTVTDAGDPYLGYFENSYGEQFIVRIDRTPDGPVREALLWCGDAGWEHPYRLVGGQPAGLVMSAEESNWLAACWRSASGSVAKQPPPMTAADAVQAVQTALADGKAQYRDTDPRFWAFGLAWEAVRFAWYVVSGDRDTAAKNLKLLDDWIQNYRRVSAKTPDEDSDKPAA